MKSIGELLQPDTIVIDDPSLRHGFTVVPNLLFGTRGLSHGARLAYVLLLKYAWQKGSCFPGVDTLAADLEVERKSVMRYTQELAGRGLITIERRGQGVTNVYHINRWPDDLATAAGVIGKASVQSRSPIHRTLGGPSNGMTKSPTSGTGKTLRRKELRTINSVYADDHFAPKDPARVAYLVEEILRVCGDERSSRFYHRVARQLDDHVIFRLLAEIRQDPTIKNRGAVFTSKVQAAGGARAALIGGKR
jgi:hypothetical protein